MTSFDAAVLVIAVAVVAVVVWGRTVPFRAAHQVRRAVSALRRIRTNARAELHDALDDLRTQPTPDEQRLNPRGQPGSHDPAQAGAQGAGGDTRAADAAEDVARHDDGCCREE